MEKLEKMMDECNLAEDKIIKNELVKAGEKFIFSHSVYKFNDYKKK